MVAICRDFILALVAPLPPVFVWKRKSGKKRFCVLHILNANQSVRVRFCETSSELATTLIGHVYWHWLPVAIRATKELLTPTSVPGFSPHLHCKKLWVVSTSLYGCLSRTHVCRSNAKMSRNLLNKLYVIIMLWYDILDNKNKLSNLFKKSSYALMWHYISLA